MNLKDIISAGFSRIPAWLLIALAAAGFWFLSRGMTLGPGTTVGYAEELIHTVGPLQAGRLKELRVMLGQSVKAGDVLAQLDPRPLLLRQNRLKAELEQAKAQLIAEQDLQNAQLQRGQIQAVRAHADVQKMRAELREYDQQVKRMQKLKSKQLIRATDVEEAQRQQRALSADLSARPKGSQRELELAGLRPRPKSDQERRLDERLSPFRVAIAVREAELAELELAISELTLRAPVDGVVGTILQRPGDTLGAGTPVLTIVTTRPGYIVAFVPERQVSHYPKGQPVELRKIGVVLKVLKAQVIELAPMVEEVPVRARPSPTVPMWGRRIVIKVDGTTPLLPGEAFRVSYH